MPAILTLIDVIAGSVSDGTAEDIHGVMLAVAPICALIMANQRGGLARPYTTSPSKEHELVRSGSRSSVSVTTSAPLSRSK